MRNFRDLRVWVRAHELTLRLYPVTKTFPKDELYGLTTQMRRCCVSIEANLAEGCGRNSAGEMGRFVLIAMGSASELDCHLLLAKDLGLVDQKQYLELQQHLPEVRRMLAALSRTIRSAPAASQSVRVPVGKSKSQEPRAKSQ
jgi:four helix bundle protein